MTFARLTPTLDERLDGLLAEWHDWRQRYNLNAGHRAASATTQDHRSPGYMDWWNGAAEARADDLLIRQVDAAIARIPNEPHPWRLAIEFQARNLAQRITVWYSPRLPPTRDERDVLLLEARNKLLLELRSEGVLG